MHFSLPVLMRTYFIFFSFLVSLHEVGERGCGVYKWKYWGKGEGRAWGGGRGVQTNGSIVLSYLAVKAAIPALVA
jgi:hypothetical protein